MVVRLFSDLYAPEHNSPVRLWSGDSHPSGSRRMSARGPGVKLFLNRLPNFFGNAYYTGPCNQIKWLMYRSLKRVARDPYYVGIKLIEALVLGLFLGALFFRTKFDEDVVVRRCDAPLWTRVRGFSWETLWYSFRGIWLILITTILRQSLTRPKA